MHTTLRHFLSVSLDPESDKSALVLAAERDPAILASVLSVDPRAAANLDGWHEHVDESLLRAIAIAMSNAAVTRSSMPENMVETWRSAITQSVLAAVLARHIPTAEPTEHRLVGLLSGLGSLLDPLGEAAATDSAAADFLLRLGCSRSVSDAVRYRRESVEQLSGTSLALRINSAVVRLADCVGGPQMVPSETMTACRTLLDVDENVIYESLGRAARAFELLLADLGELAAQPLRQAHDSLADLAADASTGAVFYRSLIKTGGTRDWYELMSQVGRFLFGFTGLCHFIPGENGLTAKWPDGERMDIPESREENHIARSRQQNQVMVVTRMKARDLMERQLLARFGANHLLCIPLASAGALVCGIDQSFAENVDHYRVLLGAYADAAEDLYQHRADREVPEISLDELNSRAREITHEVNNPLTIIQNYLGTLSYKLGTESPEQKEIDAISREISRVGEIVQKYAQIGRNGGLAYRRVGLNDMVEQLAGLIGGADDGLQVETHLDLSIPEMELPGDALHQVLLNLLKNAVEALEGVPGAIISLGTQGAVNVGGKHYVEIMVSDNGPGMSQEERLQLFNTSRTSKGEGRGLGLGIVADLVGQMSGMITCREGMATGGGKGTSFQILLPLEAI